LTAVEQLRICDRSLQVAKGQLTKTELTLKAVEELKPSGEERVFRSVGRMFILSTPEEISKELKSNLSSIGTEAARYAELKKTYEAKRDHYVKVLNDMSAKN
jgi:chaperonin cofactor prefoldin